MYFMGIFQKNRRVITALHGTSHHCGWKWSLRERNIERQHAFDEIAAICSLHLLTGIVHVVTCILWSIPNFVMFTNNPYLLIQCFVHSFAIWLSSLKINSIHIHWNGWNKQASRWYSFLTNDASPGISREHYHIIFITYAIIDIMPHTECNTLGHSPDADSHQLRRHMNYETKK